MKVDALTLMADKGTPVTKVWLSGSFGFVVVLKEVVSRLPVSIECGR